MLSLSGMCCAQICTGTSAERWPGRCGGRRARLPVPHALVSIDAPISSWSSYSIHALLCGRSAQPIQERAVLGADLRPGLRPLPQGAPLRPGHFYGFQLPRVRRSPCGTVPPLERSHQQRRWGRVVMSLGSVQWQAAYSLMRWGWGRLLR